MTPASLRALHAAATDQGDWEIIPEGRGNYSINGNGCLVALAMDPEDAQLCCTARNALPHLVALWEAAERLDRSEPGQESNVDWYALNAALAALKGMP